MEDLAECRPEHHGPLHQGAFPCRRAVARQPGEIVEYEAWNDSDGRPIDAACTYTVEGRFDWSHWWSIGVTRKGAVKPKRGGRAYSLDSDEIVYQPDGSALVNVSAQVASGNWLAMPASGDVGLLLRFYDPVPGTHARPGIQSLPKVLRQDCQ